MSDPAGVDYGIRRVAVAHPGSCEMRTLALPAGDDVANRQLLSEWLYGHLLSTKPGLVVIESPIVGLSRNLQTGMNMAMMAGALSVAAGAAGAQVVLVAPAAWKKQVVGSGNANKEQVAQWLAREQPVLYAATDADQDLVDATCMGLYATALLAGVGTVLGDERGPVLRRKRRATAKHAADRDEQGRVSQVPRAARLPHLRPAAS